MDKRIEKTKAALHATFYRLRSENAIRDIKVADLCKMAKVNKTTFYAHYTNIYELSEEVEKGLIRKIITSIPRDREYTFEETTAYTIEITLAFQRYIHELTILFDGSELPRLSVYLEQVMKAAIFARYPHLKDNGEMNFILSYCIHGAFNASMSNPDVPLETRLKILETITQVLQPVMNQIQPLRSEL